jgi:cysteinyl-tRNA synthetase
MAADATLGKQDAEKIMPEFQRMLDILGLDIPKISQREKEEIDTLIAKREKLRNEKQFEEADKIRNEINEMNIELIDHKGKTIWVRKEKIKSDV